jgi:hypothetical protein
VRSFQETSWLPADLARRQGPAACGSPLAQLASTSVPASQALAPGHSTERQGAALLLPLVRLPSFFFSLFFLYLFLLNK